MYIISLELFTQSLRNENWQRNKKQIQPESRGPSRGTPPELSIPRHCWVALGAAGGRAGWRHQPLLLSITSNSHKREVPTRSTPIPSNNLNCLDSSSDSKAVWETRSSHCSQGTHFPLTPWGHGALHGTTRGGWWGTVGLVLPQGTWAGPSCSAKCCDCPGFPSPVTAPAQRHCSSVKNTHTHAPIR